MWEELRNQWHTQNLYRRIRGQIEVPRIVFLKTWEDLLAGHTILLNGVLLKLVLGKGLLWSEP
jgi:hypothetical protein